MSMNTSRLTINVIELPIRDGNYKSCQAFLLNQFGYWTSYKGWKHTKNASYDNAAFIVIELPIRDGNLASVPLFRQSQVVIELPIRDGNRFLGNECVAHVRVIELPIRDGNSAIFLWYNHTSTVIELPIRDGNAAAGQRHWLAKIVIELPIRDGNCSRTCFIPVTLYSYWTSYKGWKLSFSINFRTNKWPLLNFL